MYASKRGGVQMKRSIFLIFAVSLSLVMLIAASGFAASANSLKYSESYKQKLVCGYVDGFYDCEVFDFGKFSISSKFSLAGIDLSQVDGNTDFYFEIGDVYFDVVPNDGIYVQGKTNKASIVLSDDDYYVTGRSNVPYMWINLSWNSKTLNVKIKGLTGTPDIILPIIAYDYLYDDPGVYNDDGTVLSGYINFGGQEWQFDVPSTVAVKQSTKKDKYKSPWDLWSISAKGTGYEVPVGTE
jgi:hypothetical protein